MMNGERMEEGKRGREDSGSEWTRGTWKEMEEEGLILSQRRVTNQRLVCVPGIILFG